jgi:hypothetical protein
MDIKSISQTKVLAESLADHCSALLATVSEREALMKENTALRAEIEAAKKGVTE